LEWKARPARYFGWQPPHFFFKKQIATPISTKIKFTTLNTNKHYNLNKCFCDVVLNYLAALLKNVQMQEYANVQMNTIYQITT
jgi:hypothetical protein